MPPERRNSRRNPEVGIMARRLKKHMLEKNQPQHHAAISLESGMRQPTEEYRRKECWNTPRFFRITRRTILESSPMKARFPTLYRIRRWDWWHSRPINRESG